MPILNNFKIYTIFFYVNKIQRFVVEQLASHLPVSFFDNRNLTD